VGLDSAPPPDAEAANAAEVLVEQMVADAGAVGAGASRKPPLWRLLRSFAYDPTPRPVLPFCKGRPVFLDACAL
jgi:hypothetical protein